MLEDRKIRVWHHVTPADGGYAFEVNETLPADYFETHSAIEFYEYIASKNNHPPDAFLMREKELPEIYRMIERIRKSQAGNKNEKEQEMLNRTVRGMTD